MSKSTISTFELFEMFPDQESVRGCGMEMGFELVYSIAQAVYGDGYALKQRWI